ncbi:MAG: M20 family metallo-hydrolase [Sulfolobales archaeon]|uniref:M20 family metallo-hydrolase n=1 Tax=Saccharolobus sp. TaxID=2100761 RepID=UPI003163EED3
MSEEILKRVVGKIDSLKDYAVNLMLEIIRRPAVNPAFGGEGEYDRAMFLLDEIKQWGFSDIKIINVRDPRAKNGVRPNIIAYIKGETSDKLWILAHLDIVPPGDLSAWTVTKPFEPIIKEGKIYGRGSEDNGQAIVSSLVAAKALLEEDIKPRRTIAIALVSDEESGSDYGIGYLIKHHPELFNRNDIALVPDAGVSDGSFIEVAEKSILWSKLRFKGVQAHASMPHKGLNPHRIAAEFILLLDRLVKEKYGRIDPLFDPPMTTCEPTMVGNSSGSPNIIPGEHEVVFDCRILPEYNLDKFLEDLNRLFSTIKSVYEKKIGESLFPQLELEISMRADAAPPTPIDSPIVSSLVEALKTLRGLSPKIGGIGGGTVAAFFRRIGIPAAVWSTIDETAHSPNEYCVIENLIADAKIIAYLMVKT